ncbi:MAG: hypothetical protein QOJ35_1129 [Solirubrobacteraceae bacterium]|jgi:hypothetical protein|nr:hypothetical protein [Solirubrobacteraceae bacterium]
MPANEAEEILALALIFVVHVAGGLMLVWGMLDGDAGHGWRPRWWRRGDEPDDPPDEPPPASPPFASRPLPLSASAPSSVRLRDETPLREGYPRAPRRSPAPRPERAPQRR